MVQGMACLHCIKRVKRLSPVILLIIDLVLKWKSASKDITYLFNFWSILSKQLQRIIKRCSQNKGNKNFLMYVGQYG